MDVEKEELFFLMYQIAKRKIESKPNYLLVEDNKKNIENLNELFAHFSRIVDGKDGINKLLSGELRQFVSNLSWKKKEPLSACFTFIEILMDAIFLSPGNLFSNVIMKINKYKEEYSLLINSESDFKFLASKLDILYKVFYSISVKVNQDNVFAFITGEDDYTSAYEQILKMISNYLPNKILLNADTNTTHEIARLKYLHISGHGNTKYVNINGGIIDISDNILNVIEERFDVLDIEYIATLYCNSTQKTKDLLKAKYNCDKVVFTEGDVSLVAGLLFSIGYMYAILGEESDLRKETGELFTYLFSLNQSKIIFEGFVNKLNSPVL